MEKIKIQVDTLVKNKKLKIQNKEFMNHINNTSYQEDGHSCGMYSIEFMVQFINGQNYEKIKNNPKINDKLMDYKKFNEYFRS